MQHCQKQKAVLRKAEALREQIVNSRWSMNEHTEEQELV
jgi:hypothetical protein